MRLSHAAAYYFCVSAFLVNNKLCSARPTATTLRHHGRGGGGAGGGSRRERYREARIRAIQQEILTKLGLSSVPDVTHANITTDEKRRMIKLYKKSLDDGKTRAHRLYNDQDFYAKRFHSFPESGWDAPHAQSETWEAQSRRRLYFRFNIDQPADPRKELHVRSAKLKLFKDKVFPQNIKDKSNVDKNVRVNIYQILEPPQNRTFRKKLVGSKLISIEERGWETFNLKQAVVSWITSPQSNHGLEISCESQDIDTVVHFISATHIKHVRHKATVSGRRHSKNRHIEGSTVHVDENEALVGSLQDLIPVLSVYTQDILIIGSRSKRALDEPEDCLPGDGEKRCCRYPVWVSFADIGWDKWIVYPEGYAAFYCDGRCPHRYKTAHNFAGIQAMLHHINPAAAPSPCCTATKLSPLTLLHYNDKKSLVVSSFDDMIVDKCKCA